MLQAIVGGSPPHILRPVQVHLCASLDRVLDLEEAHGLPRSDPAPHRTFPFRGGYYRDVRMIAVEADPDPRWQLLHELSHVVFQDSVAHDVDLVDDYR